MFQVYTYAPWGVGPAESVNLDETPEEVNNSSSSTVVGMEYLIIASDAYFSLPLSAWEKCISLEQWKL